MVARSAFILFLLLAGALQGANLNIVWPTPNRAYALGQSGDEYLQPTASGRLESALFGCVRNGGTRYHEGVDLKPIARDRRGEAIDPVYSVMDGVVAYVNSIAGNSSYGRYVVIEHPWVSPPVLTLYAHLSRIDESAKVGSVVRMGQTIGIMGRSAGGYTIPRERAHLHFEIGFWLTENFQAWYDWKGYTTPNRHGVFNGLNLIGIDPKDFYDRYRKGETGCFQSYLDQLPVAATLRVRSDRIPDFVRRYPSLLEGKIPDGGPAGWEIDLTSFGLPIRWRALPGALDQAERVRVVSFDPEIVAHHACRNVIRVQGARAMPGSFAERSLQLLFGFR